MLYQKLARVGMAFLAVVAFGTLGYIIIERASFLDSFYMTMITIASVGYREVIPLSPAGRIFTIILILGGMGVLLYSLSTVTAFIVEGNLSYAWRRRRMQKKIDELRGHFIICGAGRTGTCIIQELANTEQPFVVLERDEARVHELEDAGVLCLCSDATSETGLEAAGVARARGLAAALHSDAENIFLALAAKELNPNLRVIAKCSEAEAESKLRRAGADAVVLTYAIGGLRMASELIRPHAVSFLDTMLRAQDATVRVDNIELPAGSPFVGKRLEDTGLLEQEGVCVVALQPPDVRGYTYNPSRHAVLEPGSVLIVIGKVERINGVKARAAAVDGGR